MRIALKPDGDLWTVTVDGVTSKALDREAADDLARGVARGLAVVEPPIKKKGKT